MYEQQFRDRLVRLRMAKGVSARDMSLELGQNPSYINNIENGRSLPGLNNFFNICDFLGVTPAEFFDEEILYPRSYKRVEAYIKKMDEETLEGLADFLDHHEIRKK